MLIRIVEKNMYYKKLSTHHSPFCFINRVWRRKFLLISIVLIFLIITISLTNYKLNVFTSFFSGDKYGRKNIKTEYSSESNEKIYHNQQFRFQADNHLIASNDNLQKIQMPNAMIESKSTESYVPKNRFVHIDLKGAPPKVAFLKELFALLKKAGSNGILLEYEDTFPYEGVLKNAVADNAYSKSDIEEIKRSAKYNKLEIIPLVQTLGHLEFFLKLQEYRHLREVDEFPQAICPSNNDSYSLLTEMIDQVLAMHPEAKWLHIGLDEVYHIGQCKRCRNQDRDEIFLTHVKRMSTYLKKYDVIPIIWDDMLRQIPPELFKSYGLDKLDVELMLWTYVDDIYRFIPFTSWQSYSQTFAKIWGASAFKGAFGETLTVPNIKMHLDNNIAWLKVLGEQAANFHPIQGLVITGWQRYDHLATLCELLPSGLPSLILNLLTAKNGKYDHRKLTKKFYNLLQCTQHQFDEQIFTQDPNFFHVANCHFPGSNVFRLMEEFESVNKKVDSYLYDVTIHKAWLTDYNFRHNITNPMRIYEGLNDYNDVMYQVRSLMRQALNALREVYDDSTVYEWIEQKVYPQIIRLESFYNATLRLKKLRVWPKRPIKPYSDLFRVLNDEHFD